MAEKFPLRQFILGILSELTAGSAREPVAYLYNGVRLPKLPESYPYMIISKRSPLHNRPNKLYLMKTKYHYIEESEIWEGRTAEGISLNVGDIEYVYDENSFSWGTAVELTEPGGWLFGEIDWANFDVVHQFETDAGEPGEVWIPASAPIPVYE